jgi:peroxiredoxin
MALNVMRQNSPNFNFLKNPAVDRLASRLTIGDPMARLTLCCFVALFISTWTFAAAQDKTKTTDAKAAVAKADAAKTPEELQAGHSSHGEAFNEGPRQSAYLMGGTSNVTFPSSSKNPQVEKFINQGVGQLHGFWYFEAERSFRQAAALDPDCAIAYWGMAKANGGNTKRAKAFIAEAVKRKAKASRHEQLYIELQDKYIKADPKKGKERATAYMKALEKLVYEFPDDLDAKAFLGLAMWGSRSKGVPITSYLAVDALFNEIHATNPKHPCHHYRIHLWDYEKAERALSSAARCGQSAPSIAHMWHMPGHIYSRLKRYADGAWQQEASARVDHANMIHDRILPDQIHNFAHNNEWLIRNLNYLGAADRATALAKNMLELPRHPKYNTETKRGSSYYGRLRLFETLDRFEKWDDLIELTATPYLEPTSTEAEQVKQLKYLARAFFRSGDLEAGKAQLTKLQTRLDKKKAEQKKAEDAAEAAVRKKHKPKTPPKTKPAAKPAAKPDAKAPAKPTDKSAAEKTETKKPVTEEPATPKVGDKKPADVKKPVAEKKPEAKPAPPKKDDPKVAKEIQKARTAARTKFSRTLRPLEQAVAEMNGYIAVSEERYKDALDLFKKTSGLSTRYKANITFLNGDKAGAEKLVKDLANSRTGQTVPLVGLIDILWKAGKKDDSRKSFDSLRKQSGHLDITAPLFAGLAPIAKELGYPEDWRMPYVTPKDVGERPKLDDLGPFRWHPSKAPDFTLKNHEGKDVKLSDYRGKKVILIFYLGYGCLHCAEQLQKFGPKAEEFKKAGYELLAVSSDLATDLSKSVENYGKGDDGKKFPFPLVSNEKLDVFKAFRCFDDFESKTLHGTFVIDAAGYVRWQDISYDPFMDPDFVLKEANRLISQQTAELVVGKE